MIDLLVGDCLDVLPELAPGSIDVVVTSPPYNIGTNYSGSPDNMPRDQYLVWTARWLHEVKRVLAPNGSFFLNVGSKPSDKWVAHQVAIVAAQFFVLQNECAWVKSASWDEGPVEGHVKPIQGDRFLNEGWEHLFHLTHTGNVPLDRLALGVPYADESNLKRGTRGKNGNVRCRGDVLAIPYDTKNKSGHPAPFPPALPEACFRLHGLARIRSTLDPFSGSGSTAVAAQRLGLEHIGIELSSDYVRDAQKRLAEERERGLVPVGF